MKNHCEFIVASFLCCIIGLQHSYLQKDVDVYERRPEQLYEVESGMEINTILTYLLFHGTKYLFSDPVCNFQIWRIFASSYRYSFQRDKPRS